MLLGPPYLRLAGQAPPGGAPGGSQTAAHGRPVRTQPTGSQAEQGSVPAWCRERDLAAAGALLRRDSERTVTFHRFLKAHWKHLCTDQLDRVAVRRSSVAYDRRQALPAGRQRPPAIWKTLPAPEEQSWHLDAPSHAPRSVRGCTL